MGLVLLGDCLPAGDQHRGCGAATTATDTGTCDEDATHEQHSLAFPEDIHSFGVFRDYTPTLFSISKGIFPVMVM